MENELIVDLYDELYSQPSPSNDPTLNYVGWRSSITRDPYTDEEMTQWRDSFVALVSRFAPTRVLEVGCGTGMIMLPLLAICDSYVALDASSKAIEYLSSLVGTDPRIDLRVLFAQELDALNTPLCDLAIMNSVAQYLGTVEVIEEVIFQMIEKTRTGGHVIIGDLVSRPQRRLMMMISEALRDPAANNALVVERAERRLSLDEDVTLEPSWVTTLPSRLPRVSSANVELRSGRHPTEMNLFRFDVVLELDRPVLTEPAVRVVDVDCTSPGWTSRIDDEGVTLKGLGHAGLRQLAESAAVPVDCVATRWVAPSQLKEEAAEAGFAVRLTPNMDDPVWTYDATIISAAGG